jgi:ABC-2 type transport system permease protein
MLSKRSLQRIWAVFIKEFIQIKRDRTTFAMIIGIPLFQVILFGYAINTNPKELPTAVLSADYGYFSRAWIKGLENSGYFKIVKNASSEEQAQYLLATNQVQFVLHIPVDFERDLIRGNHPTVLLEADATDPTATSFANAAANALVKTIYERDLTGALNYLSPSPDPINLIIHPKYNPEAITQYNIVPGLMGVVLTLTMTMITAIAITRERERGTFEHLLATPLFPAEIMIGKILPYIMVGYVQVALILGAAYGLFSVPIVGSIVLLFLAIAPFIAANLSIGLMISTVANNQLQAVQMTIFFFLPSLLLSGFLFPFHGMPHWAQSIGEVLPLTHFLRIVRGILLKGNGWYAVWLDIWPILIFLAIVIMLGIHRFRRTLD